MTALSRVAAALAATLFPATIIAAALQRPLPSPDEEDDDEDDERPIGDPEEEGDDEDDDDDEEETWQVTAGPAGHRPGSITE